MGKRFIVYGLSGYCLEVIWTGFFSGIRGDVKLTSQTYIWMFFIYGLAVFLEPIHERVRYRPLFFRGCIYTVLIFIGEFTTGWLLKEVLGVCPWSYEDPLSIFGLITMSFAPVWFTVGILFEKFHDFLIDVNVKSF